MKNSNDDKPSKKLKSDKEEERAAYQKPTLKKFRQIDFIAPYSSHDEKS